MNHTPYSQAPNTSMFNQETTTQEPFFSRKEKLFAGAGAIVFGAVIYGSATSCGPDEEPMKGYESGNEQISYTFAYDEGARFRTSPFADTKGGDNICYQSDGEGLFTVTGGELYTRSQWEQANNGTGYYDANPDGFIGLESNAIGGEVHDECGDGVIYVSLGGGALQLTQVSTPLLVNAGEGPVEAVCRTEKQVVGYEDGGVSAGNRLDRTLDKLGRVLLPGSQSNVTIVIDLLDSEPKIKTQIAE